MLLRDILLPSESISESYESYIVELNSGGLEEGVLSVQSSGTVILLREGGEEVVIPQSDIRSVRLSQVSAMPADLEKELTPEDMADLIYFIRAAK